LIVTEADFVVSAAEVAVIMTDPRNSGVSTPVVKSIFNDDVELLVQVTAVFEELLTLAVQVYTGVPFTIVTPRCTTVGQAVIVTAMLDVGVGGGVGDGAEAVDPPPQPARLKVNRATKITGGEGRKMVHFHDFLSRLISVNLALVPAHFPVMIYKARGIVGLTAVDLARLD